MNDISIDNGRIINKTDNYIIYKMFSSDTGKYYMCLPINIQDEYQMVIDFPEEYYKSLLELEMLEEIKKICDNLYQHKQNAIYVLPNITTYELHEVETENDNRAYMYLLKELQKYTSKIYASLSKKSDINVSNTITIVTQTDDDEKFMHYLDTSLPGIFTSIDYSYLLERNITNDDTGWTTMGGLANGGESMDNTNSMNKPKVKKLIPPTKKGFLNITFGMILLLLSMIIGVGLAITLIK